MEQSHEEMQQMQHVDETELEMKKRLQQLFITLSEASKDCEAHLLPSITKAMLELYSIFRTIHL